MTDDTILDQDEVVEEISLETRTTPKERARVGPLRRLYRGQTSFDFVGRKRVWFTISAIIIVAGILALGFRGLNYGIEFKGGNSWQVLAPGVSQQQALNAVTPVLPVTPVVEILGGKTVQVQADLNSYPAKERNQISSKVINRLAILRAQATGTRANPNEVSASFVGPTWGGDVTKKAIEALIAFFIAVVVYISIRFEPKMAIAAFLAMLHDLAVTVGIYAIFGFQVTPDTVVAVLTILGYSLYDTVVVFDRIRDNTKPFAASGRMTYSAMVNLSMNQTLARSINTSMVAILPVLSVLLVGAQLLGAVTLQSYGVALTVGLLSGAYSSIFIASPLLAIMKEREPRYVTVRQRLAAKGDRTVSMSALEAARIRIAAPAASTGARATTSRRPTPAPASAPTGESEPATTRASRPSRSATAVPQQTAPVITPRARKQKKR